MVFLTIGKENAPGEVKGRLYQLHLQLDQFKFCLLRLEEVVRFRTVQSVERVPTVDLGEVGPIIDRVHKAEVLRAISIQPQQGRRLRHLPMSSQVRSS